MSSFDNESECLYTGGDILYFIFVPQNVKQIMQTLNDNRFDSYIIGGAVRDHIIGHAISDYDIFTSATGDEILRIFPTGKILGNETRQAKILTVIVDTIEVSSYRTNGNRTETGISLDKHLSTCDFKCNSMACDINGTIIDKYNGKRDIETKVLSCVGNASDRMKEDPLRILRVIRFSLKYGFKMDHELEEVVYKMDLTGVAQERITDELKIFQNVF